MHEVVGVGVGSLGDGLHSTRSAVRLRLRWDDFGELVSERAQPYHLMMRGRMRPWGDPRVLLKRHASACFTDRAGSVGTR